MKVITNPETLLVAREVTTRAFSEGLRRFSFRIFLEACSGLASGITAFFSVATLLAERRGISVKWR
jgi:hypothetical protein